MHRTPVPSNKAATIALCARAPRARGHVTPPLGTDCPVINATSDGASVVTDCGNTACTYFIDTSATFANSTIPCDVSSTHWIESCKYEFDQTSVYIQGNCMTYQPQCEVNATLTITDPKTIGCWATFSCSHAAAAA